MRTRTDTIPRRIQRPGMFAGGDGSTLSLDFTAMSSLDSRFTFTRSTTATYINSSGLVASMGAAASNDPTKARFDYDPTTLTPRGLLIEGASTNLFCWSESFATSGGSTNWGYNSNTGAVVSTTNPAGGSTAFQFAETANSGPLQQSVTVTNAVHTFSAWFKASTYSGTTTTQVQFGLYVAAFVAGTASIVSGPGSASVASGVVTLSSLSTSQWTRVRFTTSSALSAGAVAILIYPNSTSSETNASFHIWGAQLEAAGSGASSYIPTGASQGSRTVDICTMSNISALNYNANGGTLFAHFSNNTENANFAGSIVFNNSGNYAQRFRWGSGLLLASYFQTNGTSTLGSNLNGSRTSFASAKAATSYSFDGTTTSTAMSINGAQATTTPTSSATSGVSIATALALNSDNSSAGTDYPSIAIRSIKFWPTGLTMAQMNALTVNP